MARHSSAANDHSRLIAELRIRRGYPTSRAPQAWNVDSLSGRLSELSNTGATPSLTAAASLIFEAQRRGEPTAWIGVGDSTFFPPDFAESGIDIEALPVLRVSDGVAASRAADRLLRSGAFGLVVLDLDRHIEMRLSVQGRLAALAKRHHTALLCLTKKRERGALSLGSLVSLQADGTIERVAFNRFNWEVQVLKDKHEGPGWRHGGVCYGADGLC
jgi:recombination protein RecA